MTDPSVPDTRFCAVYTRKSTKDGLEQEFNTLDAQRESCEAYIKSQAHLGWQLLDEHYDDGGFTGANIERPAFQQLLQDIESGKVDVVIVYKVDRLSRSLLDFAQLMDRFNRAGVAFVSVTQNFSTADAMGRLTMNMLMSFAEFEREMIGERTRDKIAAARRKGKWTGGPVPLGYQVRKKHLVINELEAVMVREIFEEYLASRSPLSVLKTLKDRGRLPKRCRPGTPAVWRKDHIFRVLRNPIYGGLIPYKGEVYEGEHEGLVDRETWERVQSLLGNGKSRSNARGYNPTYLLKGLLKCQACGASFTPASTRRHEKVYRYYRCVTRDKQGRMACPSQPLPAEAIENFVVDRIREVTTDGTLARDVTTDLNLRIERERRKLEAEKKDLPRIIDRLTREWKRLNARASRVGARSRKLMNEQLEEMAQVLERQEKRLTEIDEQITTLNATEVEAKWVARALADFDTLWKDMTPDNRRRLVRAIVDHVAVDEASGEIEVHLMDIASDVTVVTDVTENAA